MNNWFRRSLVWLALDRHIAAPLVFAALLRVGLMMVAFLLTGTRVMTQGDTASYLEPGWNLIHHGAFETAGLPETDRTPGYPIFAMLTGMAMGNVLLSAFAQIVLSLVSLLLARRIADRIFPDSRAGVIAAWLFAIEPLSITYTARLMPETLFVMLLLVCIECVLVFQKTARVRVLVIAGLVLAAATFVRPISYYLGFALALGVAVTAPRQRGLWWKAPAVLLVTFLPWLAAWQARNEIETGYSGFSSIVETNLYFFQSAEVSAELQQITLGAEQAKLGYPTEADYLEAHPEQVGWSQTERLHFMRTQAVKVIASHPLLYFKTHMVGVGVVAFTPCATELLQLFRAYPVDGAMPHRIINEGVMLSLERLFVIHPEVTIVMALLEAFLLLLYLFAVWACLRSGVQNLGMWTIVLISAYFLMISGGAQAVGRYRLPVMPLLCILAAGGIVLVYKNKMRGHDSPAVEDI